MGDSHWDSVYETKRPDHLGWYQPHLDVSLALIAQGAPSLQASIIDVGGGASTLLDDLWERGYRRLTLLDLSSTALEIVRQRLHSKGVQATLLAGDVTSVELPGRSYDVWHDRAVFHFLTAPEQRRAYVERLASALKPGGQLVMATFALTGPARCSGLDVVRYSPSSLAEELGSAFRLEQHQAQVHRTPNGTTQDYSYCRFSFAG